MSITPDMITYAEDLYAPLGAITTRKMMGTLAIYSDGVLFGSIDGNGTPYLKAKGDFAKELEALGAQVFLSPRGPLAYWSLPEAARGDSEQACAWARKAIAAL